MRLASKERVINVADKPKGKKLVEIGLSSPEKQVLANLTIQKNQIEQRIMKECDDIAVSRGKDLKDKDVRWEIDNDKLIGREIPKKKE